MFELTSAGRSVAHEGSVCQSFHALPINYRPDSHFTSFEGLWTFSAPPYIGHDENDRLKHAV